MNFHHRLLLSHIVALSEMNFLDYLIHGTESEHYSKLVTFLSDFCSCLDSVFTFRMDPCYEHVYRLDFH